MFRTTNSMRIDGGMINVKIEIKLEYEKLVNVNFYVMSLMGFLPGLVTPKFLNCSSDQSIEVT